MTSTGAATVEQSIPSGSYRIESTFRCDACQLLKIGGAEIGEQPANLHHEFYTAFFWAKVDAAYWHSVFAEGQDYPDVPTREATPVSEAHTCRSVSANMSAILMARSVIEAGAKDRGIISGSLFKREVYQAPAELQRLQDAADALVTISAR